MPRVWRAWLSVPPLLVLLLISPLLVACDSPPQILEITPVRGARDVRTSDPIRIRFDRPLDQASVASRFSIHPEAEGQVSWEAPSTLVFRHQTLRANTQYAVSLNGGYRDTRGQVNTFNHSWTFLTERPPEIRASTPGQAETQVDPSSYLTLTFSREMNPQSFADAVTFSPPSSFAIRGDPADARRVILAPKNLLASASEYQVSLGSNATDIDGNHLVPARLRFATGPIRSLSRWITFLAARSGDATAAGVWMVDEAGFPRLLEEGAADAFVLSPDGTDLLIRHADLSWIHHPLGGTMIDLPFKASWASYLGPEAGYVFLSGSSLSRLLPGGQVLPLATGVTSAAVSHDRTRLAFVVALPAGGTDIRAYDVELRAQYRLQHESDTVTALSWAPNATRLAYLTSGGSGSTNQLRVKSLAGGAAVTTLLSGDLADPVWLADSNDLVFSARVPVNGTRQWRVFRINTSLPPPAVNAGSSISPSNGLDSFLPQPSPDGHQIAFLVGTMENAQVWVMNADGTGVSRLTAYSAQDFPYSVRGLHWASP